MYPLHLDARANDPPISLRALGSPLLTCVAPLSPNKLSTTVITCNVYIQPLEQKLGLHSSILQLRLILNTECEKSTRRGRSNAEKEHFPTSQVACYWIACC
jgi:hypothetical protein